jgi:hypothetical protein
MDGSDSHLEYYYNSVAKDKNDRTSVSRYKRLMVSLQR